MRRVAVFILLITLAAACAPQPAAGAREWWDEVIYFVFIDRFHNRDQTNDIEVYPGVATRRHGGDLQGIIDKLDYIASLGMTAIWITPHLLNAPRDYHGYGAIDFYKVDPHVGTLDKLKELVQKAHRKNLKVLFDIVVNHAGPGHPFVTDPAKPDWFHPRRPIQNWGDRKEVEEGWLFDLPDFNTENAAVVDYLAEMSKWWIKETGVDGFRLDTVKHVPVAFWQHYTAAIRKDYPHYFFLGEAWVEDYDRLAEYQAAGLNALIDFPFYEAAKAVFGWDAPVTRLRAAEQLAAKKMQDPFGLGIFLDNHDVPRFVHGLYDPEDRLRLALVYLYTSRGVPIVYYGTEVALDGGRDPDNRRDMPFGRNPEMTRWVTKLGKLRQAHPALRRGDVQWLHARGSAAVYSRTYAGRSVIVVLNNGDEAFEWQLPAGNWRDELAGAAAAGRVSLAPRSAAVCVPVR